jgi:hypothetical protein
MASGLPRGLPWQPAARITAIARSMRSSAGRPGIPASRQHRHRRVRLRQAQEVPRRQAHGHGDVGVDDVPPPWQPRAVEVRGQALTLDKGGKAINEGSTTRLSGSRLAGSCPGASRTASRLGRSLIRPLTTRSVDHAASVSDLGTSLLTRPGNARWCASLTCVERRCQPEFGQAALTCHGDQMTLQSSPRLRARRGAACRSMLGPPGDNVLPIGSIR